MSLLDKFFRKKSDDLPWDEFELLSNERIQKVLTPKVTPHLEALGFKEQKPLHWLRSDDKPVRQLYAFARFKGGGLAPRWGLSLDYVPHVAGSKVAWHRTEKSARFDLLIEAHDYEDGQSTDFIFGERHLTEAVERVASASFQRATKFWHRFRTVKEMPAAFEWWKASFNRGGRYFSMKGNQPLAYAFSLAVNGRTEEARKELDAFLARGVTPETHIATLRRLLEEAASRRGQMRNG